MHEDDNFRSVLNLQLLSSQGNCAIAKFHPKRKMTHLTLRVVLLTLGLVLLGNGFADSATRKCHDSLGKLSLKYLASKAPYIFNTTLEKEYIYTPEGCTPVKFWFFGRHGTRNPGKDDIKLMQSILPSLKSEIMEGIYQGRSGLCPYSIAQFASWKPRADLDLAEASFLQPQGWNELSEIAERYKNRFPNLFPDTFDNTSYLFKHTDSQRTEASGKAFAEGIFGPKNDLWMPVAENPDPILKFYDACPKYIEEVDENPDANREHNIFVQSELMNKTISAVSRRFGLSRNMTLEEIIIVYVTCAFETAWKNGVTSPWCVAFDEEDFKVLEYQEDLDYYYKDGYGHQINYEQACPPFKDVVQYFENYLENPEDDKRTTQGYFSHSGANLKMLARLSMFGNEIIKADNYEAVKDVYQWKSSIIDTMASNMAFTLFSCPTEYKIGYYFQELPQPFPACDGKAFCSFQKFREQLSYFVDDCNLEEICRLDS